MTVRGPEARYRFKLAVLKSLYRRGWDRQRMTDLFRVIDWMMHLPEGLELKFRRDIDVLEEEATMRYVTSIERIAKKEGMELGIQQGLQQGMQQGRVEGRLQVLRSLLEHRFGPMPDWAKARLESASESDVFVWTELIFNADAIEDVLGTAGN